MADDPTRAKAEAWWGSILASAREKATTAEVWDAIRSYASDAGVALPSDIFQRVNDMRSLAVGLRTSSESLMRASTDQAITNREIGQQLYARSPFDQAAAPLYHVRFEMTTQVGGQQETGWYTLEYSGQLPATVGDLFADLGDYADGLAGSYGQALVATGRVEIGAW